MGVPNKSILCSLARGILCCVPATRVQSHCNVCCVANAVQQCVRQCIRESTRGTNKYHSQLNASNIEHLYRLSIMFQMISQSLILVETCGALAANWPRLSRSKSHCATSCWAPHTSFYGQNQNNLSFMSNGSRRKKYQELVDLRNPSKNQYFL